MMLQAIRGQTFSGKDTVLQSSRTCKTHTRQAQLVLIAFSGIYVDHSERWPEHFRGIGIRIEDSVCVQEDSPLVLTTEAVKEVCSRITPV